MNSKKLLKSKTDKKISGVCGGIGKYCDIDPTIIRLAWLLLTLFTAVGIGVVTYIVCACIIPEDNN